MMTARMAAIADSPTPGTVIENQATASYLDTADNQTKTVVSDIVKVTVAEVAGITITPANTPSAITGSTANFDFTITNVGNDPTQFFIPDAPSAISGGTAGTLRIVAYDPDGSGPAAAVDLTGNNVTVPGGGGNTGTLLGAIASANNGSIPPNASIVVRVPVTVTGSNGQTLSVTLGNTSGQPSNTNTPYILGANGTGTKDLYTVDNADSISGESAGTPINGDATNHRQEASAILQVVIAAPPPVNISGTVFEDPNYGGGAGRNLATANTSPRDGAKVELYKSDGTYISNTTTSGGGKYTFTSVAAGTYKVRVVNSTVTSSRPGYVAGLLPVQTFRTDASSGTATNVTDRVGGEKPKEIDAPANTSANLSTLDTATQEVQSLTTVTVSGSAVTGIDFGYNFDTIVNTNDSGQGSLRQFIINSNALTNSGLDQVANPAPSSGTTAVNPAAGEETSIFMIPAAALTSNVAVITPTTQLPTITDANTTINGLTQTANIGDTNSGQQGTGGTVGVDALTLSKVNQPEIQIVGTTAIKNGLSIQGANTTIRGLAIYGFGNALLDGNIIISANTNATLIEQNFLGTNATSFSKPAAGTNGSNIVINSGSSNGVVQNNLIAYANFFGTIGFGLTGWKFENNEISDNSFNDPAKDGISLEEANNSNNLIKGNLITSQGGNGIDSFNSSGGLSIENNTVTGNGLGSTTALGETPGIRLFGTNNKVYRNIIFNNYGPGVMITASSTRGLISQNSIYGNGTVTATNGSAASGQIGIDLLVSANAVTTGTAPYISANNGTVGTGGNNGMDYPIITSSSLSLGTLTVQGYVGNNAAGSSTFANATLEFFISEGTNQNQGEVILGDGKSLSHGEGKTYIGGSTPGNLCTTNATGFFNCTFANAGTVGLTSATNITATATDSAGNTSEFSSVATSSNVTVTGTVFSDADADVTINGSDAGTNAGSANLTIYAIDTAGKVLDKATVAANGTYSLTNVPQNSSVKLRLSNDSTVAIGATAPTAPSIPSGWYHTGENLNGTIDPVIATLGDIALTTTTNNLTNENFGIRQAYTIAADTAPTTCNPDYRTALNTGITAAGGQVATGANDLNWTAEWIAGPASGPGTPYAPPRPVGVMPAVVVGNLAPGAWINEPANARWISYPFRLSSNGNGTHSDADLDGINGEGNSGFSGPGTSDDVRLKFTSQVTLPSNANTISISLPVGVAIDNQFVSIKVNGVENLVPTPPADPLAADYGSTKNVNLTNGWQAGVNTIEITLISGPNQVGFFLGVQATTTQVCTNPNVLMVKRITAINGDRTKNPNDNTPLNAFVDDTTSTRQADDNSPNWKPNYLLGAIDAGKVKPGDEIEYTVYFLNAGSTNANTVRMCDRITANQDFKLGAYGTSKDVQLQLGTSTVVDLTSANDASDRTQLISAGASVPTNCYLKAANNNGTLVIDLTGNTGLPTLTTMPGSTAQGSPNDSYGFFRFVTKVKP